MRATIEGWHPANHANARMHHMVKARVVKAEKAMAWWAAREAGWRRVEGKAALDIVLVFPKGPLPDADNCVARCKAIIDGLKGDGGYFTDDSPEHLKLTVRAEVQPKRKATILTLFGSGMNPSTTAYIGGSRNG